MAIDYITSPEDVVVASSGWAKVGDSWQTLEPLRDQKTGLYARPTYGGGKRGLARLGLRMPTRAEVDARRAATLQTGGVELPIIALPDQKILTDLAAEGIVRSNYPPGDEGDVAFDRASRRDMGGLAWARYFDQKIQKALEDAGWNGRSLISNLGKMWIAGASPGRALLKGWWDARAGAWVQQGTAAYGREFHDENHHDYGTLLYGVSDTDPALRDDATPRQEPPGTEEYQKKKRGAAASIAVGAGSLGARRQGLFGDGKGPAEGPGDTPSSAPTPPSSVLLVGDSLAQGLTKPLGIIAKSVGIPFKGDGIVSSTIRQWLASGGARAVSDLKNARPSVTVVSLGTNDMRGGDPAAEGRRAGELIALLQKNGPPIRWIGPPDMPFDSAKTEAFRTALAEECQKAGVPLLDSRMFSLERAKDKIHLTEKGYRDWAAAIADWLGMSKADASMPDPRINPATGKPWEVDPSTLPLGTGAKVDPKINPATGKPWAVDPSTLPVGTGAKAASYKPATKITQAMLDWINTILHDPATYPLGAKADKAFVTTSGTRVMQARVETHPPDAKIPRPHRGVGLWEAPAGTAAPDAAPAPGPPRPAAAGEAPALVALRSQLDRTWPRRAGAAGNILASAAHTAKNPNSDHEQGEAIDLYVDKKNGPNLDVLAEALLKDPRTKYLIWRGRIANTLPDPDWTPGAWRRYPTSYMIAHGSKNADPHTDHLHLSIRHELRADPAPWDLSEVMPGRWDFGALPPLADEPSSRVEVEVANLFVKPYVNKQTGKVTVIPPMPLEAYIAHVVQGEINQPPGTDEALKAQAIAARTFLRWQMLRNPRLGGADTPLENSEKFQVAAPIASARAIAATEATRGALITYGGRPILAYYVAGAPWAKGGVRGEGSEQQLKAGVESRVTYNQERSGLEVLKAYKDRPSPDDHGAMSSNGATELARQGMKWPEILHFFYGADVEFTTPRQSAPPGLPISPGDEPRDDLVLARIKGAAETSVGIGAVGILAAALLAYGVFDRA